MTLRTFAVWASLLAFVVVMVFALGVVAGVSAYALIGPGANAVPEGVQLVLLTVLAGVLGAVALVTAAVIGAYSSREATKRASADKRKDLNFQRRAHRQDRRDALKARKQDREDASQARAEDRKAAEVARLHDIKVVLMSEVLQHSQRHFEQVRQQVARRMELAITHGDPASIPTVEPTEVVGQAAGSLYAVADQATADAAWAVYNVLLVMDRYTFDAARHLVDNWVVPLEPKDLTAYGNLSRLFLEKKTEFIQQMRRELGLQPLVAVPPAG